MNSKDTLGVTALMYAATYGHFDVVKTLIESSADVNMKSKYGETALMIAARDGTVEVVKALIDAGAEVNAKNDEGKTALDYSSTFGRIRWVLKRAKAKSGRPSILKRLKGKFTRKQ